MVFIVLIQANGSESSLQNGLFWFEEIDWMGNDCGQGKLYVQVLREKQRWLDHAGLHTNDPKKFQ